MYVVRQNINGYIKAYFRIVIILRLYKLITFIDRQPRTQYIDLHLPCDAHPRAYFLDKLRSSKYSNKLNGKILFSEMKLLKKILLICDEEVLPCLSLQNPFFSSFTGYYKKRKKDEPMVLGVQKIRFTVVLSLEVNL